MKSMVKTAVLRNSHSSTDARHACLLIRPRRVNAKTFFGGLADKLSTVTYSLTLAAQRKEPVEFPRSPQSLQIVVIGRVRHSGHGGMRLSPTQNLLRHFFLGYSLHHARA